MEELGAQLNAANSLLAAKEQQVSKFGVQGMREAEVGRC